MTPLDPIISAVQQAAKLCQTVQAGGFDVSGKGDASPVTIADYGAQAIICRAIAEHYPGDAVIAEEGGAAFQELVAPEDQARLAGLVGVLIGQAVTVEQVVAWLDHGQGASAARTWVIDPIDGTVGFVNRRYYAICVGLLVDGQPAHGVIGMPQSPIDAEGSLVYTAKDGGGVMAMALDGSNVRRVGASGRGAADANLRVMESYKLASEEMAETVRVRAAAGIGRAHVELYDSQLKYAMIAAGYGDVFVRLPRDIQANPHRSWDHAAGAALVLAAGGTFTGPAGEPVDFSVGAKLDVLGFVATNGNPALHTALVGALKAQLGAKWPL